MKRIDDGGTSCGDELKVPGATSAHSALVLVLVLQRFSCLLHDWRAKDTVELLSPRKCLQKSYIL